MKMANGKHPKQNTELAQAAIKEQGKRLAALEERIEERLNIIEDSIAGIRDDVHDLMVIVIGKNGAKQ